MENRRREIWSNVRESNVIEIYVIMKFYTMREAESWEVLSLKWHRRNCAILQSVWWSICVSVSLKEKIYEVCTEVLIVVNSKWWRMSLYIDIQITKQRAYRAQCHYSLCDTCSKSDYVCELSRNVCSEIEKEAFNLEKPILYYLESRGETPIPRIEVKREAISVKCDNQRNVTLSLMTVLTLERKLYIQADRLLYWYC